MCLASNLQQCAPLLQPLAWWDYRLEVVPRAAVSHFSQEPPDLSKDGKTWELAEMGRPTKDFYGKHKYQFSALGGIIQNTRMQ